MQNAFGMHALSIKNLSKKYKSGVEALKSVSFDVQQGDFFALLGPNGAGKTTAIGIITSLVNKSSGSIEVFGHDIDKELAKAKSCIGVVPQEVNLNLFDFNFNILVNQAGFYGIPRSEGKKRAEQYLKKMQLWEKRKTDARSLSGGMKRRLMVARALVNRPKLLLLDEPTAGVDIELRQQLWTYIKKLNEYGTTIILTTHYLEEAEELCDTIAIVDNGQIVRCAPKQEILNDADSKSLTIKPIEDIEELSPALIDMGAIIDKDKNIIIGYNPKNETSRDILRKVEESGLAVSDFTVSGASLETVFLSITSKK